VIETLRQPRNHPQQQRKEGDLIMGKGNKSAIVTLVERSSRLLVAFALRPGTRSDNMRDQLIEALGVMPVTLRRTLTWDRGSEMAKHAEVTAALGTLVYFCDPASPWQRASNENANGLLDWSLNVGLLIKRYALARL
jgi:IS30 family transposase